MEKSGDIIVISLYISSFHLMEIVLEKRIIYEKLFFVGYVLRHISLRRVPKERN